MEIILDTANVSTIKKYNDIYNITGVTTNPTILSRENTAFFPLLQEIQSIIGDKQLHVQVTAFTSEEMIKEAHAISAKLGKDVYIKVPTNEEGIKTMKILKSAGFKVTATAIYTSHQAMLASTIGVDYVAPYFNRMSNMNIDSKKVISEMAALFKTFDMQTKILAASFKNVQQIMDSLLAGAHAVTASAELYTQMLENDMINGAITGFSNDWINTYGAKYIYEL